MEQQKRLELLIQQKIRILEEEAKKRIANYLREKRKMSKRLEEIQLQRERLMLDQLNKAFRKSENQLISVLEKRKAEIRVRVGKLIAFFFIFFYVKLKYNVLMAQLNH